MERKMELDWSEQAAKLAFLMLGIHFVTFWEGLSWDRDAAWFSYLGEVIFNLLVLVGLVKAADHIAKEMLGL